VLKRAPEKMLERPSRSVMPTANQRSACAAGNVPTYEPVPTARRVVTLPPYTEIIRFSTFSRLRRTIPAVRVVLQSVVMI
jgi:hypothetical protein